MKKTICALLTAVILLSAMVPMAASAAEPRILSIIPGLSFSGTTATCELTVLCDYSTDEISATVRLWEGNTCIKTWYCSDEGGLGFSDTATVTKGQEYTVTADVTLNGVAKPRVSISKTCQ